jgi:hypothetical protein
VRPRCHLAGAGRLAGQAVVGEIPASGSWPRSSWCATRSAARFSESLDVAAKVRQAALGAVIVRAAAISWWSSAAHQSTADIDRIVASRRAIAEAEPRCRAPRRRPRRGAQARQTAGRARRRA